MELTLTGFASLAARRYAVAPACTDFWEDNVTDLGWEMYKHLSSFVHKQTTFREGGYHYSGDSSCYLPKTMRKLQCLTILFV